MIPNKETEQLSLVSCALVTHCVHRPPSSAEILYMTFVFIIWDGS